MPTRPRCHARPFPAVRVAPGIQYSKPATASNHLHTSRHTRSAFPRTHRALPTSFYQKKARSASAGITTTTSKIGCDASHHFRDAPYHLSPRHPIVFKPQDNCAAHLHIHTRYLSNSTMSDSISFFPCLYDLSSSAERHHPSPGFIKFICQLCLKMPYAASAEFHIRLCKKQAN